MTRATLRSYLFVVAINSFSAGGLLVTAMSYLVSGNWLGVAAFTACAVMFVSAAIILGIRSLNGLDMTKEAIS